MTDRVPHIFKGPFDKTPWTVEIPDDAEPWLTHWSWHPTWRDALNHVHDYYQAKL